MNIKNTKRIFDDFPEFFPNISDLKSSLMAFGFEHDDGWFDLVYQLCKDIKAELKREPYSKFEVLQVKEKFGGLRFYITSASGKIFDLIDKAEDESYKICEICGKTGRLSLQNGYYYRTLCTTHRKLKNAKIMKREDSEEDLKTFHVSLVKRSQK